MSLDSRDVRWFSLKTSLLGVVLALVSSGCCADTPVADDDDGWNAEGGPQASTVMGSVVFSGGGGVVIDLSTIKPSDVDHTGVAEITAWAGSRDTSDPGDTLPSKTNPPTTAPLVSASTWNLVKTDSTENAWRPGEISSSHDTNKDQFWVYVEVKLNRVDGNTPRGRFVFRFEWDATNPADGRRQFPNL